MGKTIEAEIKVPQTPNEIVPRRGYITKVLGVVHSEECRRRIETEMKEDPEEAARINVANKKRAEFVMKHGLKGSADEREPRRGGEGSTTRRREPDQADSSDGFALRTTMW